MTHSQLTKVFAVGALVGTLASCTQNPGPFYVSAITVPGPGCTITVGATSSSPQVGGWALDVTANGNNSVPLEVTVSGFAAVSPNSLSTTSTSLDTQNKIFFVDQISYTYDSSPAPKLVGLVPETLPVLFPVTGDLNILMPMIGAGAAAKLPATMSPGDQKRLNVTFELRGREGGSGARFTTGPTTFPIDLFRGKDCASGLVPERNQATCLDTCIHGGIPICFDPAAGAQPPTDAGC